MKAISFYLALLLWIWVPLAHAGHDAARVPEENTPWSGYWWPRDTGELVLGYSADPAPLEKYDAYLNGYFPATATLEGLESEYDPDAYPWIGHCDDWAAASVLAPEPTEAGDLLGIPFKVGDKKALLTLLYSENQNQAIYGTRYEGNGSDPADIHPGGENGFHQTLIRYIKTQGEPIILDLDPGPQIWNYPAFAYEMEWTDQGDLRHVTCTVWLADDNVHPDFVGTASFTESYTYVLELDENGQLLDSPGYWEKESADFHPDFLWYPKLAPDEPSLETTAVEDILASTQTGSDDRFEPNNQPEAAWSVPELKADRFYWASAQDPDWYEVHLSQGDDFIAFALSPISELDFQILHQEEAIGESFHHGAGLEEVPRTGAYQIGISSQTQDYYNVEFFSSPARRLCHTPMTGGWQTDLNLINPETMQKALRFNLFGEHGERIAKQVHWIGPGALARFSLNGLYSPEEGAAGRGLKVLNIDGEYPPFGFFSYRQDRQRVHLPLTQSGSTRLWVPHITPGKDWWTGLALGADAREAAVTLRICSAQGRIIGTKALALGPGERHVSLISDLWEDGFPSGAAWMECLSDAPIQGYLLWGNTADPRDPGLAGIPLLQAEHQDSILYLPHVAVTKGWWTGMGLINPNEQMAGLTVKGYGREGEQLAQQELSIPAYGSWVGSLPELFENASDIAWAEISGQLPVAGFAIMGQQGDHLAGFPLFTRGQAGQKLWLKSLSPDGWTGLALLNPFEQKADVWAYAYDEQGNLLNEDALWYNPPHGLKAGVNGVGYLSDFFGQLPEEAAYLRILSDNPILGFGLWRNGQELDTLYLEPMQQP